MLVSFEVRVQLRDASGDYAQLVRGNEFARSGNRLLNPFGGGIETTDAERKLIFKEFNVKVGEDLRFEIQQDPGVILKNLFENMDEKRIIEEAKREFEEESIDERRLLTARQVEKTTYTYIRRVRLKGPSVRHKTLGQPTLYFIGVVRAKVPLETIRHLRTISSKEGSLLEFVPPNIVKKGGVTKKRSKVTPLYNCLTEAYTPAHPFSAQ